MLTHNEAYHIFQSGIAWTREMLQVFVFRLVQNETDPHEHVFYEIVYIQSGTADHITVSGIQKLHPGDVIVLKPRTWHQYRNPQNLQLINCLFDSHLLRDYRALFELTPMGFELFRRPAENSRNTPPITLHARPTQQTVLLNILEAIISEQAEKKKDWEAAVVAQLLGFLVAIARIDNEVGEANAPSAVEGDAERAAVEIAHYLEKHFRDQNTLADLARRFHFSEPYLSRIFSKHMGMGIIQFQHHLRIEEACRMLRFSTMPISRIAGNVGYDELPYFSRRFRLDVGMSPREYRATYNGHFRINDAGDIRKPAPQASISKTKKLKGANRKSGN